MAILIVKQHGQEIQRLELTPGQEYIAGRASESHIVLPPEKGISRQHVRLYNDQGVWIAELLSRFGALICGGEAAEAIELADGVSFAIPPFEFFFKDTAAKAPEAEEPEIELEEPARSSQLVPRTQATVPTVESTPEANLEATTAGVSRLVPFLRIYRNGVGDEEILKLEGNLWVAGRDATCEIHLDDDHVSRKHFELTQTSEGFYITDLGSANGTNINDERIPANEPYRLTSGDKISVMDISIDFEVRDPSFQSKLQVVPKTEPSAPVAPGHMVAHQHPYPMAAHMPTMHPQSYPLMNQGGPAVLKVEPPRKFSLKNLKDVRLEDIKRNKVRVAIVALVPFIIYGALSDSPKPEEGKTESSSQSVTFDKLKPEQKSAVKDTFNLARNLYVQGKYELCLAEIRKLHETIPYYENSKELEAFCAQGSELLIKQKDMERMEREREQIEKQIASVTEECKIKLDRGASEDEVRTCLGPAIELDPEHPRIVEIFDILQQRKYQAEQKAEAAAARQARVGAAKSQYRKAKRLLDKGELRRAIIAYDKFLKGNYPTIGETDDAKREIASARKELEVKVSTLLAKCKELYEKNQYKAAVESCAGAIKEDPSSTQAKEMKENIVSDLNREMKTLYQDSILEESLGNVEAAKEKWKKITSEDLTSGEYFKKAKKKLSKYGIEI